MIPARAGEEIRSMWEPKIKENFSSCRVLDFFIIPTPCLGNQGQRKFPEFAVILCIDTDKKQRMAPRMAPEKWESREFDLAPSLRRRIPSTYTISQALSFEHDTMAGHPRLVNMSTPVSMESDTTDLRLADGVATFLNLYNPVLMRQLLDPGVPSIFFCRKKVVLHESNELIIKRNTNVVTVGWCSEFMTDPEIINGMLRKGRLFRDYDTLVKFCIQPSGEWTPMCAQDEITGHELTKNPNKVERVGTKAARRLLMNKEWMQERMVTITTSDLLQHSVAHYKPIPDQNIQDPDFRAYLAADLVTMATPQDYAVVEPHSNTLPDTITHNRGTKTHITQKELMKHKTTEAPVIADNAMNNLAFQTSALNFDDIKTPITKGSSVNASSPEAHVAKAPVANTQVVDTPDMENSFWQANAMLNNDAKANAIGKNPANAAGIKGRVAENPVRKSSRAKDHGIEEYEMEDLDQTL